jgi:hypothetical protein
MDGWRKPNAEHGEVGSFEDTLIECNNVAVTDGKCLFHEGSDYGEAYPVS